MDLDKAYHEEEVYWKQKSKDKWVLDGDKNTCFFHGSVQARKIWNKVSSLLDANGIKKISEEDKGAIAVDYFEILFWSSNSGSAAEVLDGLQATIT